MRPGGRREGGSGRTLYRAVTSTGLSRDPLSSGTGVGGGITTGKWVGGREGGRGGVDE